MENYFLSYSILGGVMNVTSDTHSSLAVDEFRDMAFGERSKSESERYRKDSRRWLWGKLACSTRPEPGLAWDSRGLRPTDSPFSTSKLWKEKQKERWTHFTWDVVLAFDWAFSHYFQINCTHCRHTLNMHPVSMTWTSVEEGHCDLDKNDYTQMWSETLSACVNQALALRVNMTELDIQ